MVKSIAYAIGPLLGAWLLAKGEGFVFGGAVTALTFSLIIFSLIKIRTKPVILLPEKINLRSEIGHWKVLGHNVWPVLTMSFLLILVDATFWTVGTMINDEIALRNPWGGWMMTLYMIPSLFVGLILVRLKLHEHKKRWAQIFMVLGGIVLAMFSVFDSVAWYLFVVFISSCLLAMSWPLVDAIYTDLIVRMGVERQHLIGLCSSMGSLGYILGPILAGWLAGVLGMYKTFSYLGVGIVLVSVLLLIFTPRKLKLPQSEIETWG